MRLSAAGFFCWPLMEPGAWRHGRCHIQTEGRVDFTKQIAEDLRLLVEDVQRRLEAALQPFADSLDDFLALLFQARLPSDWRRRWHDFVADQADQGFFVEDKSIQEFEDWIESWARFCDLLPRDFDLEELTNTFDEPAFHPAPLAHGMQLVARLNNQAAGRRSPFMLASVQADTPDKQPPPVKPSPPPPPKAKFNDDGVEVAGPGPATSESYRAKVQKALEILDPRLARWWQANGVSGQVRSRVAAFWQFSHYSRLEERDHPVIVVDENYTAGQTAQAIISEVAGGWFADSVGVFYKKQRFLQTGDIEEFQKWQRGAAREAARLASQLAEMYISGIATLTPAGDLVVLAGDVAERGLKLDQLLNLLPLLAHVPIGAIVVKLGKRELKLPKQLARDFEKLSVEQRKSLLVQAAAAKTDDESVGIIKRAIATAGTEHHIATNKTWISTLRGGPWSPRFEKLFKKAGLTLADAANKIRIPAHHGPHPEEYHRVIFDRLEDVTRGKRDGAYKDALLNELQLIANEARTPGTILNRLLTE